MAPPTRQASKRHPSGVSPTIEVEELRRLGNRVHSIQDSRNADMIRVGNRLVNLDTSDGRRAFLSTLHLHPAQVRGLDVALDKGGLDSRDELGQLVSLWANIDRGLAAAGRMVMSGHHVGRNRFWGDENGFLSLADFSALGGAFPRAAGMVEDLHLSASYSATSIRDWLPVFSNLKTIWAYAGSAPGSVSGACIYLQAWDAATRGPRCVVRQASIRQCFTAKHRRL